MRFVDPQRPIAPAQCLRRHYRSGTILAHVCPPLVCYLYSEYTCLLKQVILHSSCFRNHLPFETDFFYIPPASRAHLSSEIGNSYILLASHTHTSTHAHTRTQAHTRACAHLLKLVPFTFLLPLPQTYRRLSSEIGCFYIALVSRVYLYSESRPFYSPLVTHTHTHT